MADAFAFIGEIIFRLVFENLWYLLKRGWYVLTGRASKGPELLEKHRNAQAARRQRVDQLRAQRRRRKGGK